MITKTLDNFLFPEMPSEARQEGGKTRLRPWSLRPTSSKDSGIDCFISEGSQIWEKVHV